jgi:tRNA dimethylallyltransferase
LRLSGQDLIRKSMSVDAVLIAGPTASGKSAAALALAEHIGGTIINADSMQVYAELSVLTARPSAADVARVPHRLYGHISVKERYSVGRYEDDAGGALVETTGAGRIPIFVGGTGLYFDVLMKGLSPIPAVPLDVREATRRRFEAIGREAFHAELARRDPKTASKLRISDTQRLLRAMDVLEATGRPLSEWQALSGKPVLSGVSMAQFVLAPPREAFAERIDRRFREMLDKGAVEEARALLGLPPDLPAARALGLPQLWRHLRGETSLEEAVSAAQLATGQYVKRQLTWFRNRMSDWRWLESGDLSNFISSI